MQANLSSLFSKILPLSSPPFLTIFQSRSICFHEVTKHFAFPITSLLHLVFPLLEMFCFCHLSGFLSFKFQMNCHLLGKDFLSHVLLSVLPNRTPVLSWAFWCPACWSVFLSRTSSWMWPCVWLMGCKRKRWVRLPRSLLKGKQRSPSYFVLSYSLECRCKNWSF